MHAPNRATQVTHFDRRNFYAGVCQSSSSSNNNGGWFVPYLPVSESSEGYEAVINLFVLDLSSTSVSAAPFVIDTGLDVTIIPRRLMNRPDAFQADRAMGPYDVVLKGRVVVGQRFRAAMFVPLLDHDATPLSFGVVKPVVVDEWDGEYGMLGLDALRRVLMVSDRDHISLWPAAVDDQNTEQEFYALAEQWRRETSFVSIASEQANNFAYHQIIGMGKEVLPFIFREIRETTSDWFWALRAITRTDVDIASEDLGDVDKIAEAWDEWGIDHGYAHR